MSSAAGRWADGVPSVELRVVCGRSTHTIQWERGALRLLDHDDVDAELALVAFGGAEPPCLARLTLWNDAVTDGGFLGEWVDEDLDQSRLWWLGMALERMRSEGFHEFLRELTPPRAARMGQFLTSFPVPWLDRAAASVAESLIDGPGVICDRAPALLPVAVARRLRRAFVTSVGGRQVALGAAALVPFQPVIDPLVPFAEGVIRGRASQVRIGVEQRWLFDVWGAGLAVLDGHLILDVDHRSPRPLATIVVWDTSGPEGTGGGAQPRVEKRELFGDGTHWRLDDSDQ